ncbi:PASTA domain-containing protein [Mycolicibacterium fallax]|uniref:PASTA domain-containing protein n=1 Tax=Mycolicibacterium fallax TaxID=1793 RepID=A0A1X1REX9_MYCFA|nr:PASTA domain-containing protein [Mycolicibacterium fallax]ORV04291.1 hypothetical protein AWC04_09080 [Mycolicibacterium fallax]BBY98472.1 hypothetical protein MFAL_19390 [Mycolicibacterium fallax]
MRRTAALAITALLLAGPFATAGTAAADDDEGGSGVAMPDLRGGSLAEAQETMAHLDAGFPVELDSINIAGYPQKQYATNMWKVCSQLPKPGTAVTPETYAAVGVVRKGERCG